jgi:hypothetical protein
MAGKVPTKKTRPEVPRAARATTHHAIWKCPACGRSFAQKNQRHACGTGDRSEVLRNRPAPVVALYSAVEAFVQSLGPIEIVARERYVLFRSVRIFTDLVIMTDAVRVAIHLGRRLDDPIFFKVASDEKRVTHVAKLQTAAHLAVVKPYLKEAYEFSLRQSKR